MTSIKYVGVNDLRWSVVYIDHVCEKDSYVVK